MADHVFADSLCLTFGLSPDLAVDVETCMAPAEDFIDQGRADELFLSISFFLKKIATKISIFTSKYIMFILKREKMPC